MCDDDLKKEMNTVCLNYLEDIQASDIGDYECGKNCEYSSDLGVYVCEDTFR
jgi:hypothetical protein